MADIKKSAQAAALEATGLSSKIDELRREFKANIDRCEDRLREDIRCMRGDIRGIRDEMASLRQEMANDRQQLFQILSQFMSREAPLEVRDRGPSQNP